MISELHYLIQVAYKKQAKKSGERSSGLSRLWKMILREKVFH
jgi:hypothetical protein